ncbi:protein phosphatase 2C domain-containing protein [Microbacteriaceae bacterium VKM Ac-2854]|nr:protein phosphatase 2C domain-containing protein [Microbacteriaceae bacterium VKM Ac-2854]
MSDADTSAEVTTAVSATCPNCGEPIHEGEAFCEACGFALGPAPVAVDPAPDAVPAVAAAEAAPIARPCVYCGGVVADDGYCEQCGQRAPTEREHWVEQPIPLVAGVCDRGLRHAANEDAMALAAFPSPSGGVGTALLVVCDGVSSTPDSDTASLAAARAAREVLVAGHATDMSDPNDLDGAAIVSRWSHRLQEAVSKASDAIDAAIPDIATRPNPPSCTFTAAVLDGSVLITANVGDSRSYWVPDAGDARQLTTDDSWAQQQIAEGMPRAQAESAKQAHAITRWLGADAHDEVPRVVPTFLSEPGWVLACSDGLWNYSSAAAELGALVHATSERVGTDPAVLAEALVAWANEQGGHDNITVALARFEPGAVPVVEPEAVTAPMTPTE